MGRLICSWCERVIEKDYPIQGDSHGVCPVCASALKAKIAEREVERLRELRMEGPRG